MNAQQAADAAALVALSHRNLSAILRELGGGTAGFDTARATKEHLAAYAVEKYDAAAIQAAISKVDGMSPHVNAYKDFPAASASTQPLPPATDNPVTAAVDRGEARRSTFLDEQATKAPAAPQDAADRLAAALREIAASGGGAPAPVDPEQVREIAFGIAEERSLTHTKALAESLHVVLEERFAALEPMLASLAAGAASPARVLDVRSLAAPEGVKVTGQHPLFEKVLRLVAAGVNVLLVGPAGCGKTHLAEQVAAALGRSFGALSLTAGTTESALTGRLLPSGEGGRFGYFASPFVRLYEGGGVFLFDELDAADPNMLLIVNSALANGHIEIEARAVDGLATRIARHAECCLLGAANTFGTGASAQYVGRGALDAATVDRWYVIEMTYDPMFEASLFGGSTNALPVWTAAPEASLAADVKALGDWVLALRAKAGQGGLRRIVSSRMIQKAVLARRAGVAVAEVKADLLAGWSEDELRAIGEAR